MTLPLVRGFTVPELGVALWDSRTPSLPRRDLAAARRISRQTLGAEILEVSRPGVRLCGPGDGFAERRGKAWAEAREEGLSYQDFEARLEAQRDESDTDPRREALDLVVYDKRGTVAGIFGLYNVRRELELEGVLRVNAMPLPGVRELRLFDTRQTWALLMRFILETNVEIDPPIDSPDPSVELDVVEWVFPQRRGHQWTDQGPGEHAARVVASLEDAGHTKQLSPDGAPLTIRRANA